MILTEIKICDIMNALGSDSDIYHSLRVCFTMFDIKPEVDYLYIFIERIWNVDRYCMENLTKLFITYFDPINKSTVKQALRVKK